MNERIRVREVRLIDEAGSQLGVLLTRDALEIARERGLDLVEVQPNAQPPVCRLMDYGRFRYEESRKERDSRRRTKSAVVKEVRIYPKIGDHDLKTKARRAQRFLEGGEKVKMTVLFRGREMLHQDIGRELLQKVVAQLEPFSTVDQDARMEGRMMSVLLSPKKEIIKVGAPATDGDELLEDEAVVAEAESSTTS